VLSCSEDLQRLAVHLGQRPRVLLGHSFGGKVCLQYAEHCAQPGQLEQVWLLDSNPAQVALDRHSEVSRVFDAARSVATPIEKRLDVAEAMRSHGLPERIATWMTTNLRLKGGHYEWLLNFDIVQQLLDDYGRLDCWPFITRASNTPHIHWVIGEQSDRIDAELRARGHAAAQHNPLLDVHLLPDAGHWVHVDNPEGLVAMLDRHLPT
jgi:pimeloyl-ACP methyl ester carboxylesterase